MKMCVHKDFDTSITSYKTNVQKILNIFRTKKLTEGGLGLMGAGTVGLKGGTIESAL